MPKKCKKMRVAAYGARPGGPFDFGSREKRNENAPCGEPGLIAEPRSGRGPGPARFPAEPLTGIKQPMLHDRLQEGEYAIGQHAMAFFIGMDAVGLIEAGFAGHPGEEEGKERGLI